MLNEGKRFRHLDLGIFLTPDPLEYVDGFNPYIYCNQNPWGRWDPLGLEGEPSFWSEYKRAFSEQGAHIVSFGVDTLPVVGSIKSLSEIVTGKDLITGKNVSRLAAVAGIVPFGKNIKGITSGAIKNISEETAEQAIKTLSKESKAKASKEVAEKANKREKTYQTYIKKNEETGEVYSGRTSGTDTPRKNVENRDHNHHKNAEGFGPAELDKTSSNPDAIRGREQNLINKHGGAKSQGGTSGNAINGISKNNPKAQKYMDAAKKEFGDK